MNDDLKFNEHIYGIGAGVFFATYAIFGVPSSILVRRIGAKYGLPLILFAWGFASAAMALINNVVHFYVIRLIVGATEAGFFPAVIYYLTLWFAEEDMGLSYTIVMTSTAVSGILGGPLAGIIMTYMNGWWGVAGWRWLFIMEAVPTVLLAVFMFFYLDAEPGSARFLEVEERRWLVERQKNELERREGRHAVDGLSSALKLRWLWIIIGVWLLYSCGYYGIIFWLPLLLKSLEGMSNVVVGFVSALPYICAGAGMILVARSSDRTRERRFHLAISAMISAVGFFAASSIRSFYGSAFIPILLSLCLAAAGIWSMFGPYWGIPTSILSGDTAAASFALINSVGVVGGYIGPYLVGELTHKTGSYDAALAVFGGMMTLSAILTLQLKPNIGISTRGHGTPELMSPLGPKENGMSYSNVTDDELTARLSPMQYANSSAI